MAVTTLTEQIDNLYTTTWQNMKSKIADSVFDGSPFWFWLKAHGGLDSVVGGRFLTEPIRYAASDNVTFITKGDSVSLSDKEFLTTAKDDWKYMVDTIVRFGIDDQQNRGKNQIISLMRAKLDNSKDSLVDQMEVRLCGAAGANQYNGLQDIVADDPTTGTVHNINRATYSWWRNQYRTMTTVAFNTSDNGVTYMQNMVNRCAKNLRQDAPDIIVSAQDPFEYYWLATLEQRRIHNKTLGDAGFQNVEFMGIPIVWSPQITDKMYFLNTRFLKFKYDPSMNFDMTKWKEIPDQVNDRAAQVILAGNLMTSRSRVHGVLFAIDTP
jgi:hypothetical protein